VVAENCWCEGLCCGGVGVQSAAVNVICELARKNPKNYLSLAPLFFKLMTSSTNNWVLIKIIKLVGRSVLLTCILSLTSRQFVFCWWKWRQYHFHHCR